MILEQIEELQAALRDRDESLRLLKSDWHSLVEQRDKLQADIDARTPPWLKPNPDAAEVKAALAKGAVDMHNGASLFWEANKAGGRTYSSDEIGGGVEVWDTCLVSFHTLCEAMAIECAMMAAESRAERKRLTAASAEFCTVTSDDIEAAIAEVNGADARLVAILRRAQEQIMLLEQRQAFERQRAANPDAPEQT